MGLSDLKHTRMNTNAISNSSMRNLPTTGRNLLINRSQSHRIKQIIKRNTLKAKRILWILFNSIFQNFWFVITSWLYISHSSILEFGGRHTIKQLPRESPDLFACPWLLRLQIWWLGKFLSFHGLTNFMLKWIWCGSEASYDDFYLRDI